MLSKIKTLIGLTDGSKDDILGILILDATADALLISAVDFYDNRFDSVITKMVVFNYNRLGQEDISSQSYSGVSETYTDGYPIEIIRLLKMLKKVRFY